MKGQVTLEDLEVRYTNIRKNYPTIPNCSISGCKNPIDGTKLLGWDTCCAYHRLLFDFWSCDVYKDDVLKSTQKGRRRAFTNWRTKLGKKGCDEIVLKLMQEPINWEC